MRNVFKPELVSEKRSRLMKNELYEDPRFFDEVEANLQWLIDRASDVPLTTDDATAFKYQGDLTGLLMVLNVPANYIYIITRMNGYFGSDDYNGDVTSFIMPQEGDVSHLMRMFKTTFNIK